MKRLPDMVGGGVAEGTTVTFSNGQASWLTPVMRPNDSYGMPTGRRRVSVPLGGAASAVP